MKRNEVAIEEAREGLANHDVVVVGFGEERQYLQGSGDHLDNDGRTTFCLNMVRKCQCGNISG